MRHVLPQPKRTITVAAAALLGLLLMVVFFGPTDDWAWDPSFYYAHIRSPLIEHDLDFRNETQTGRIELGYTSTGLQNSEWPIGPSLLWSPSFLAAHGLMLAVSPAQADGFAALYLALVSLASIAYGAAGLLMIYQLCRAFAELGNALLVTMLCLGATPLFYYLFRQPIAAHTTGLFAAAAMVLIYVRLSSEATLSPQSGLLFGVTLGLCFLTRWHGLLLGLVPTIYFAGNLAQALRRRSWREVWPVLRQAGIMTVLFLLTVTPQLALWYRLHGSFFALPQGGAAFVDSLLPVNLPRIFFHTNRGLVFWCPFVLIGMVGIACIPDRPLRLMAALITLGQVLLIGYRVDWYSGGGFGARYYIELLPFLAIGAACLLGRLPRGVGWSFAVGVGGAALVLHQFVLMHAVEHGPAGWLDMASYYRGTPLGVSWQVDALLRLLRDPGLWFAPRPNVGVDRQTILVNLVAGLRDPGVYLLTGAALVLAAPMALLVALLWRMLRRRGVAPLMAATTAYFMLWAVFILLI